MHRMSVPVVVALVASALSLSVVSAAFSCEAVGSNEGACLELKTECLWCPSVQHCTTKCSLRTNNRTCSSDTFCVWVSDTRQCVDSCSAQYSTSTDCAWAPSECSWNSEQSVCQQNCTSITNSANCNAVTTCHWSYNRTQCLSNVGTFSIANPVFAAEMNKSAVRPVLIASMVRDLTALYDYNNVTVIVDRIVVGDNITRVPFVAPSFWIPWEATWCINVNGTWLSSTWATYTRNGGADNSPLVVTSFSVSSSSPATEPPASSATPPPGVGSNVNSLAIIVPTVVGTILVIMAVSAGVALRWRHNPYAVARQPAALPAGGSSSSGSVALAAERFSAADHERLRCVDGAVLSLEAAVAAKQRFDATHGAAGAFAGLAQTWPDVAFVDVPRNTQRRVDLRNGWDALTGELLPTVIEQLTHLRVVVDLTEKVVKCDTRSRLLLFRYSGTIRILARGDGVECLLVGRPRCVVTSRGGDVLPFDPEYRFAEGKRDVGFMKRAFEASGLCSHIGTNEERKVVFARLAPMDDPVTILCSEMNTAAERQSASVLLVGLPVDWPPSVALAAVRLMLRLAPALLVDEDGSKFGNHVTPLEELVTVHRSSAPDEDMMAWRVRSLSRDTTVLRVLGTVANRFWAANNDETSCRRQSGRGEESADYVLYCQCAAGGVGFNPIIGRNDLRLWNDGSMLTDRTSPSGSGDSLQAAAAVTAALHQSSNEDWPDSTRRSQGFP